MAQSETSEELAQRVLQSRSMSHSSGEINLQQDMQVVAEASNGLEAIAAYRLHRLDVTLMDIQMPDMGGIKAITQIRATYPAAKFVVLPSSAGDVQAMRALQPGATGYLLKNLPRTELIDTIRIIHSGQRKVPAKVAQPRLYRHVISVPA